MTDRVTERRSKVVARRVFETDAVAFIPVAEWWEEVPPYPGSIPTDDEISVTEPFDGSVVWLEAMEYTTDDSVEAVTRWYLTEMQRRGWRLLEGESRVEYSFAPDHRRLRFTDRLGELQVRVSVRELGKFMALPAKAPTEFRKLHDLLQRKWEEVDRQAAERTGQSATYINLSWSQRRSPLSESEVSGQVDL
jgi:hypothetical protein